jgi:hypothetical protein
VAAVGPKEGGACSDAEHPTQVEWHEQRIAAMRDIRHARYVMDAVSPIAL